jgi:hypothetical protein
VLSKLRSSRPGHGTVVAYTALSIALRRRRTGSPTGSIHIREIKNNSLRSADIRNNTVCAKDVRTGTLRTSDVGQPVFARTGLRQGPPSRGSAGPGGAAGPCRPGRIHQLRRRRQSGSEPSGPNWAETRSTVRTSVPMPARHPGGRRCNYGHHVPRSGGRRDEPGCDLAGLRGPQRPLNGGMKAHIVNHTGSTACVEMTVACGTAKRPP